MSKTTTASNSEGKEVPRRTYFERNCHCAQVAPQKRQRMSPSGSAVNFAPLIEQEKLLVHGLYDEGAPLETAAKPLYQLMTNPKTMVVYPGAQFPDTEYLSAVVSGWLDKTLGTVRRERSATGTLSKR